MARQTALQSSPQRKPSSLRWWLSPALSLLWRVPLLLGLMVLALWFAFRGLAHLSFVFIENPVLTFLAAPLVLPCALLPALCFYACFRILPALWRNPQVSPGQRTLAAGLGPLVALILAQFLDLIQINAMRLIGILPPRLPFDPY